MLLSVPMPVLLTAGTIVASCGLPKEGQLQATVEKHNRVAFQPHCGHR